MNQSDDVWKQRILCSDGNCIGIIGSDGCCKECGTPYSGDLPLPSPADGERDETSGLVDAAGEPSDEAADDYHEPADPENADGDDNDDWEARTLCVDESCIGIVGPDGRCKECGKPHPGRDTHDVDTDH